jgi:peroxiredoxin
MLLVWYGYKLVKKSLGFSENIHFITDDMGEFVSHLEAVYEMQTFYGDETLQNLLLHSKRLADDIEEFKIHYVLELEEQEGSNEYGKAEEAPSAPGE